MTCIAGIEHAGKVFLAGDSAGSDGMGVTIRADEKVWADEHGFAFGFTSSFRMGQLLRYKLTLPLERHEVKQDDDAELKFMSTAFLDAVRGSLKGGGFARVKDGVETGGTFLVGWRGKLYMVYDDFQVGRAAAGFHAVGSGDDHALGALYALRDSKIPPKDKLLAALSAAQHLGAFVREPFKVVTV